MWVHFMTHCAGSRSDSNGPHRYRSLVYGTSTRQSMRRSPSSKVCRTRLNRFAPSLPALELIRYAIHPGITRPY